MDFLTIVKYRKNDINNILGSFQGLGSWDAATKAHMMAYDKQLTLQQCTTRKQFFKERYEQPVAHSYI